MGRSSQKRPLKPRIALVGDGETEQIYFANVKDTDRPSDFDLYPDLPGKPGSYKGVLDKACQLATDYSRVYALIDMDKIISDGSEQQYQKDKKKAIAAGVFVLENNPCFEIWLLLHCIKTTKSFSTCDDVIEQLKKSACIPGYSKNQKSQVNLKLYGNYRHLIAHAITAAQNLEKDRPSYKENKYYPRAEAFQFFEWYFSPDRIRDF